MKTRETISMVATPDAGAALFGQADTAGEGMTIDPVGLRFVVPLVPPSVNHYKGRSKSGRYFVHAEAKAFKASVAVCAAGRSIEAKEYALEVSIYLGKGQKGDGDNFWKVLADGLKEAGVIRSDAAVKRWVMELGRDWENPRTEIFVKGL